MGYSMIAAIQQELTTLGKRTFVTPRDKSNSAKCPTWAQS